MKILNIAMSAPFTEGYSYQDNLLTEYQHKLGHDVTILTGIVTRDSSGRKVLTEPCDKILSNGVRLIRIKPGGRISAILGYHPQIKEILNRLHPDLIFIHGLSNLIAPLAISYKKRYPATILAADNHQDYANSETHKFPFAQLMLFWRLWWKKWVKSFNHIYGTTSWRKDFAVESFGIPEAKIDILPMGVDSDNLPENPHEVRMHVRKNLGIKDTDFVFIHGGKMNIEKKTLQTIRAFKSLQHANVFLILFGSASREIKEEIYSEIESDTRIKYLGYLNSNDCKQYFYAADFGVYPGLHSVLWEESAGCGLPCLYGKYSGKNHLDICDNCLQLEQSASESQIADTLLKVCVNREYYATLKANALRAAKSFSYREIARKSIRE